MTRGLLTALFIGSALAASALAPALADDADASVTRSDAPLSEPAASDNGTPRKLAQSDSSSSKSTDGASKADKSGGGGIGALPLRLASFTVGFIGGVPVALVKKSAEATMDGAKDLCGTNTSPFLMVPAAFFSTPWGVLSGGIQAPFVSAYNAWKYSEDEPFGKATFGLGDGD